MRKAQIAEWLLRLFTTPERAVSVVGDLMEAGQRFWLNVAGTVLSLVWSGMTVRPIYTVGLGLQAWAMSSALSLFLPWIFSLVLRPDVLTAIVMISLVQFYTGMWIARRAPGREFAACLVFIIATTILNALVWSVVIKRHPGSQEANWIVTPILRCVLLSGSLWVRIRPAGVDNA